MIGETFREKKYIKKDTPAFKEIRKVKRNCAKCKKMAVAIMNGEVLCGEHAEEKRYNNRTKWNKMKR